MKRPNQVVICGQPFTVKWENRPTARLTKNSGDGVAGAMSRTEQLVAIRTTQGEHQLRDTVLHEVVHAILALTGQNDRFKPNKDEPHWPEEPVVAATATGLLAVLRDNPDLVAWLVEDVA